MRNIKLTIEYDGTNYHGWQSQLNADAVQDVVKKAVKKLTGEDCNLIGASRTDSGVHALGQVANFLTGSKIPIDKFPKALNSVLPDDVVIRNAEEVDETFHSRFAAKGKKYRYLIYNSKLPSALLRNRAYHVPFWLDLEAMKLACGALTGRHDFSAFRAAGSNVKTSERTIFKAELSFDATVENRPQCRRPSPMSQIVPWEPRLIEFEIEGDGFLYNMVRIIAGTLVEIGMGGIPAGSMAEIICSRQRNRAGKTAPAHGLYLVEVYY